MKAGKPLKVTAWLVTRHWIADDPKWEVAAILSPRLGGVSVRPYVEFLHLTHDYTLSEQASLRCSHSGQTPYSAHFGQNKAGQPWEGEVLCGIGHDPFLRARKVDDLMVERNADGTETVTWKERVRP
ncbi:MAG: hypothetical protein ABJC09_10165 [Terriglobia bacterium]